MIHFKCPDCSAGLRVDASKAGKLTACPSCGRKVRAPARSPGEVEIVEELPVVEDEDDEILDAVAADDEGRRRKRRRKIEPPPPEDEELGYRDFMTRNRLMGIIGVIFGIALSIAILMMALTGRIDLGNYLGNPYNCGGCLTLILSVLLIVFGVVYAIRG